MQLHLKVSAAILEKHQAVVVAVGPKRSLSPSAILLNEASKGQLLKVLEQAHFEGKSGQTLPLYGVTALPCELVLVVGTGDSKELDQRTFGKITQAAAKALVGANVQKAVVSLAELVVAGRSSDDLAGDCARALQESVYRFDAYKSKKENTPALSDITLTVPDKAQLVSAKKPLTWGNAVAAGIAKARDLGNTPSNICTPRHMAEQARQLVSAHRKMKIKILGESALKKLGAGAFLSVSKGSDEEGQLIVIEYQGGRPRTAPIVLVGKGITFDTGGISIKPAANMDEMKFDMCGAASVLGVMTALAASALPVNVVGILACAENMPSGLASKPGDIVTTLSGQTVEILNTDAEGRLVLSDALTYAARFKPKALIDVATLTGACVVALGKVASGLFSTDDELASELLAAADASGDKAWRMPVWSDYQEQLDSPFADMANIGGPNAGSVTAACFLSRFTKGMRWAHLDIAGTAWMSGANKGATGRPVPLLMEYLRQQADHD